LTTKNFSLAKNALPGLSFLQMYQYIEVVPDFEDGLQNVGVYGVIAMLLIFIFK
jgi:hypothetical protein